MTRAGTERGTRRVVSGPHGEYVVTVLAGELRLRPIRSRNGEVRIGWESLYVRLRNLTPPRKRRRGAL